MGKRPPAQGPLFLLASLSSNEHSGFPFTKVFIDQSQSTRWMSELGWVPVSWEEELFRSNSNFVVLHIPLASCRVLGYLFFLTIHSFASISSVQSLSRVRLFATPWIAVHQASLSITNSRSSLRFTSIESVMPFSHLILCRPLLL